MNGTPWTPTTEERVMYDDHLGLPPIYESEPARGGCLGVLLALSFVVLLAVWLVL